jgi:hypothetical protein
MSDNVQRHWRDTRSCGKCSPQVLLIVLTAKIRFGTARIFGLKRNERGLDFSRTRFLVAHVLDDIDLP